MIEININNETREFDKKVLFIGYLQENKVETIQFNFPEIYENFNKKVCFKTNTIDFIKLLDNNVLYLTNDITKYRELDMAIEFFNDDIVARTSKLHLVFEDTVVSDDVSPDEPKVDILNDLINQVDNINIDLENTTLTITKKDGVKKSVDTKGEKGDKGEPGKFTLHIVDGLPEIGEDGVMYLIKKENGTEEDLYNEYIYADGKWNLIGNTHIDLTDYYMKSECYSKDDLDAIFKDYDKDINDLYEKQAGVELTGTYNDSILNVGLNDENGEQLSKINIEIPQYQELHYTWDKTTGEDAIELFQMVYSYYRNGKLINVDLKDGNKIYKLTNISQPNSMGTQYWCQFRTLDWYTDNVDMVFLQTVNAVLEVNGGIVNSIEVKESVNQFALIREYNGSKGALPVDNTKEYIPTGDYEPATKQYVDISHYKRMPGWSSQRNQILKNINGIPTWVNE